MRSINIPISDTIIRELKSATGIAQRYHDHRSGCRPQVDDRDLYPEDARTSGDDLQVYQALKPILMGGVIYHCGPVVSGLDTKQYKFVAAGPTTSIREEPYQAEVMKHFNLKGVIGKGGMAPKRSRVAKKSRVFTSMPLAVRRH